mgnify:CR=1 FL=1
MWFNRILRKWRGDLSGEEGAILLLVCIFTVFAMVAVLGTAYVAQILIARAKLAGATQATARAMTESRDWFELLVSHIKYTRSGHYAAADPAQHRAWIQGLLQEQGITSANGFSIVNIEWRYASRGMGFSDPWAVICMVWDHALNYERFDPARSYDALMGSRHSHPFYTIRVTARYRTILGQQTIVITKSAEMQELRLYPG